VAHLGSHAVRANIAGDKGVVAIGRLTLACQVCSDASQNPSPLRKPTGYEEASLQPFGQFAQGWIIRIPASTSPTQIRFARNRLRCRKDSAFVGYFRAHAAVGATEGRLAATFHGSISSMQLMGYSAVRLRT